MQSLPGMVLLDSDPPPLIQPAALELRVASGPAVKGGEERVRSPRKRDAAAAAAVDQKKDKKKVSSPSGSKKKKRPPARVVDIPGDADAEF